MTSDEAGASTVAPQHTNNGEENVYPNYLASFHKGLPHDELGEVDPEAYRLLLRALSSRSPEEFEKVPLGTTDGARLVNPLAGLMSYPEGPASDAFLVPPAPRLDSAENAAEVGELYWMAHTRDVPFTTFDTDPVVAAAAEELSALSGRGFLRADGVITPQNVFRGPTRGDVAGPFVSQFLLKDLQFGTHRNDQRQDTVRPGQDYMTTYDTWLKVQNGLRRALGPDDRDRVDTRFITTPRDLAHYVHFDAAQNPFQPFFGAALVLQDLGMPLDGNLPYRWSKTQDPFATFGYQHLYDLVTDLSTRALRTVWYQKWWVHRRLRPEAHGGLLHHHLSGRQSYDFLHRDLVGSAAVARAFARHGTYLLPQAFPEGSPLHPSYAAGHATVAGACATILKAWFDETAVVPDPVVPSADGRTLVPYTGPDAGALTVGGEIDKLAANIATGRNMAGVHYRSDFLASVRLGEALAIEVLRRQKSWFAETHSYTLTRFDGQAITI